MTRSLRHSPSIGCVLLLLSLTLGGSPALWAQNPPCPPPTVVIQMAHPAATVTNIGGTLRVDITNTVPPAGYTWSAVWLDVYEGTTLRERGAATRLNSTTCSYNCVTSLHPNSSYTLKAWGTLLDAINNPCDIPPSPPEPVTTVNPTYTRHAPKEQLDCVCLRDCVETQSSTSPLTGHEGWSVPVASWEYHGESNDFALTYASASVNDPQAPTTPDFAGLSETNSHWSHNFAQWIDLYQDTDMGTEYAVWHQDGHALSFAKSGSSFTGPYSSLQLSYDPNPDPNTIRSPAFPCNGTQQTLPVPYLSFTVTDEDGTVYEFNKNVPTGQNHLYWKIAECLAVPHYLLTRIKDRWGRITNFTRTSVDVRGVLEPRVTKVSDSDGSTTTDRLTLAYSQGLVDYVDDWLGRRHDLSYTQVPDTNGQGYYKLTGVTVLGPGSPNRVVHTWSFLYVLPNDPNLAQTTDLYGGSSTGDLVIRKIEPHEQGTQQATTYKYEPVELPVINGFKQRVRETDWHGRVTRISWPDDSEGTPAVDRVISRTRDTATQATLTSPSPPVPPPPAPAPPQNQRRYTYSSTVGDVTSVTEVSTGRAWSSTYEDKHNLLTVRTPLEPSGTTPLVEYRHEFDSQGRISKRTELFRKDDGSQGSLTTGDAVETLFNTLNLPTQIKAAARPNSGNVDEVSQVQYDGGGVLTVGNLTKIIEAVGTTVQQETNLFYDPPDGTWGLPTRTRNELTAESSFDYDNTTGQLLSSASPENLLVPIGHVDRAPSMTVLQYNTDFLPSLVQDPEGHQVSFSYNAQAVNSPNLVITATFADGSWRTATLDAAGRLVEAVNEKLPNRPDLGVKTVWTYNPQDQVRTITRNAGDPDPNQQRVTTLSYNDYGDLRYFDPPRGSDGRVSFEYIRYDQNGAAVSPTVYEGRLTHTAYADGRHEYLGYDTGGELSWQRKSSGNLISIAQRDALHRVTKIDYPAEGGSTGFSVITAYDDFGRVQSSTDYTGTTTLHWDALDRPTQIAPPAPQKTIDFSYQPDTTTFKRWTTTLTVSGIGAYQYSEDTKGRLFQLTNPFSQVFQLEYDKDGKNTLAIWPNGVKEERTYTNRDWLASLLIRQQNTNVLDLFQYFYTDANNVYDPTGHLRREVDMGGRTHAFSYSKLYELTQESHPDATIGTISYTYNKNGDRLTRTQNGVTDYYGVAGDNRLIWMNRAGNFQPTPGQSQPYTQLGYNTNGQVNYRDRRFTTGGLRQELDFYWDGGDRLRQVKQHVGGATFFSANYDGEGVRVNKTDTRGALGLQVDDYSYGPQGLLWESNPSTIYTPGFGHRSNGISSFYHVDWLGSTRYTSDSTGNTFPQGLRYDAYGNRSATADPANWHPTDKQWAGLWEYQTEWASATDPGLGLDYLEQRYYDPQVGRFLSSDPIGFLGGTNLYAYVDNDPVNEVDPSGLGDPEEDFEAAQQHRETQRVQINRLQRQVHTGLRTVIEVGSSFNEGANAAMAVNDAGEGKWWSAALRLSGPLFKPLSKLFGRVGRFCRPQMRPGFARLPFGPLKIVSRDPNTIRFSQNNIKAAFRNVQYGTVESLVQKLKSGVVKPEEIEPIRLVEREGHLITIDNRRLYAFREAGVPIRTRMATPGEIREAVRQGKCSAGPLGSTTIRVRGRR